MFLRIGVCVFLRDLSDLKLLLEPETLIFVCIKFMSDYDKSKPFFFDPTVIMLLRMALILPTAQQQPYPTSK